MESSSKNPNLKNESEHRKNFRMQELVKIYGGRKVVDEVSFEIKQGEIVGLLGPNGAGKTTSFYMSVGFIIPESGSVFIDDQEITTMPMYKRARMGIGYLAQEASIFRKMTVAENIEAVLETMKLTRKEIQERRDELLMELQITRVANQKGFTLSGGERRRCEIARALATRPHFILLDEPFAGVDPIAVKDIQSVIQNLKEKGLGILITDHNVRETLKITDRAYIMYSGKILISGSATELINDPETRRIYLGEDFKL
jgi:lipopolysaccharide export system ATP-binding protein